MKKNKLYILFLLAIPVLGMFSCEESDNSSQLQCDETIPVFNSFNDSDGVVNETRNKLVCATTQSEVEAKKVIAMADYDDTVEKARTIKNLLDNPDSVTNEEALTTIRNIEILNISNAGLNSLIVRAKEFFNM